MSDNWVVSTLEDALNSWNNKLTEIWSLVSQTPESFRGGEIWTVIVSIHNALVGFGYGLLVLFLQWVCFARQPASANCKGRNLLYGILSGFCLQKWRSARRWS